ncbi:hypothetical protein C8Q76DRAFT_851834 [Earliella scabrosa]|nr:hypothetical protein C8Q76DRAFT_851834 [Earliella scabrosa]
MFRSFLLVSSAVLGLAASGSAGLLTSRAAIPFDGQYIKPTPQNNAVEWWWVQAGAPAAQGQKPPSFHITFYQGYPFASLREAAGGVNAPQNYIVINGAFPNGTVFAYNLIASDSSVTYSGNAVSGSWPGAGSFKNAADLSTFTVKLDAPNVKGTLSISSRGPYHFGCNSTTDPYFASAIPAGTSLSDTESVFFKELGWATSQPGGATTVDVTLDGTPFKFTGQGYHDQNWMPRPIDKFIDVWYFLNGQVGPFDFSAVYAAITGSTRDVNTGYLGTNGVILQNQCALDGAKTKDRSVITPWGVEWDAAANQNVMKGFIVDYTLVNGDKYSFNVTGESLVLGRPVYHRWVGTAVGGKVGGTKYSGTVMYDWVNPSLTPYDG